MDTKLLGRWGEEQAQRYLMKKHCRILGLNYGCRLGEIDIIAEHKGVILFVEVKTRASSRFATAREAVNSAKQRRIIAAATLWMSESGEERPARFDVIEIYAPEGMETKRPEIVHLENAFM